jgi:methionyl-tRNA formyltransferase
MSDGDASMGTRSAAGASHGRGRLRLAFFGSGAFGLPTLAALVGRHEIAMVVTQPDKPAGRGGALTPTPIASHAHTHMPGVPIVKAQDVNDARVAAEIRAAADAWVVIAFGQKLGPALLEGVFAINLHGSLLPRWRGAAPIHAAILAGDAETGVSVITLAQRMDAGLVLGTARRAIDATATTAELHDHLAQDGAPVVLDVLERHIAGTLTGAAQDESRATRARKLSREDAWIDFADAEVCRRRVNAFNAWPGVTVGLSRDGAAPEDLKVWRAASLAQTHDSPPGTIVDAEQGLVACGTGTLRLLEVQSPGKKAMSWESLQNGRRLARGTRLIGRGMDGANGQSKGGPA